MKKLILENLEFASVTLVGFLTWFFYGKKKSDVDLEKTLRETYGGLVEDLRVELTHYRDSLLLLQKQFNAMNISYAQEVERSQNWEKLHFELSKKYDILKTENEALKKRVSFLEKKK